MSSLAVFNSRIEAAVENQDGNAFRALLRDSSPDNLNAIAVFYRDGGPLPHAMPEPWSCLPNLVHKCFLATGALRLNNWVDAYDHIADALNLYITALAGDTAWSLPLFHNLCEDVRVTALVADDQLRDDRRKPCKLESAERILKKGFAAINGDRRDLESGSRRIGGLGIINQLLKVYFKINNLGLCGNLTRTVTMPAFPDFPLFPLHHRVTYKFYEGRLLLYEDKYGQAVEALTYALQHTPKHLLTHRRRILLFLIPANILTGRLPSQHTLEYFNMKWYKDIVCAMKQGNLGLFENTVLVYEEFFIRSALYLVVEKMKAYVYRALVKKLCAEVGYKIDLSYVSAALRACQIDSDRDEVECVLANLIHQNFIKGYISHKVGVLVLSKKNPFPPPAVVQQQQA